MLIGTNNIGKFRYEQPEWVFRGIKKIVDTIQSRLPKAAIVLHAIFPRNASNSDERKRVTDVNERIAKLADGKQIMFPNFGPAFLQPDGEISPDVMPDGLHLTAKGYEIWYQQLEPVLSKLIRDSSATNR